MKLRMTQEIIFQIKLNQNIEGQDSNNLEKMILATGIRVGTPVKTKFMSSFIVRS